MGKHFEFTGETKTNDFGVTLHRIRCTEAFGDVEVGDLGGWIEKEENLSGDAWVSGDAEVFGSARVSGDAWVSGDARISGDADYCCFQGFGSACRTTTVFRTTKEVKVKCGCFFGTLDEFAAKVEKTHGDNKHGKVYKAIIEVIKLRFAD